MISPTRVMGSQEAGQAHHHKGLILIVLLVEVGGRLLHALQLYGRHVVRSASAEQSRNQYHREQALTRPLRRGQRHTGSSHCGSYILS